MNIVDLVESQIIASVVDEKDLDIACRSNPNVVFLLTGDLLTSADYIKKLQSNEKTVFLHLDFIEGLSNSKSAVEYIAKNLKPTGIITTKSHVVKYAKEYGLVTIQRIFLLDAAAIEKGIEMVKSCNPNAVEILPGIMPKIIDQLVNRLPHPIIAGGLVTEKKEVLSALKAGALAVSAGDHSMWNYDL
ncbi:antiterminator [Bacillus sp. FJAT-21945]|nr:antiterminator [Bacillus sp. FJAT-21945]